MKTIHYQLTKITAAVLIMLCSISINASAQDAKEERDTRISVYSYRYVAPDKIQEYIKRETTYWSKVAEEGMKNSNLVFWGLFHKVGGFDIENSPNILIINTYSKLDPSNSKIWDASKVFPDVPMDQIETESMFKQMHTVFVKPEIWVKEKNAVPEKDFNFINMIYHNSPLSGKLIDLEGKHWAPFIKKAMDDGLTTQKAFGNARILSPNAPSMNANSISMDVYSTLQEALDPQWDESTEFPMDGLKEIMDYETDQRFSYIYRVVKVVQPPKE